MGQKCDSHIFCTLVFLPFKSIAKNEAIKHNRPKIKNNSEGFIIFSNSPPRRLEVKAPRPPKAAYKLILVPLRLPLVLVLRYSKLEVINKVKATPSKLCSSIMIFAFFIKQSRTNLVP